MGEAVSQAPTLPGKRLAKENPHCWTLQGPAFLVQQCPFKLSDHPHVIKPVPGCSGLLALESCSQCVLKPFTCPIQCSIPYLPLRISCFLTYCCGYTTVLAFRYGTWCYSLAFSCSQIIYLFLHLRLLQPCPKPAQLLGLFSGLSCVFHVHFDQTIRAQT